MAAGGTQPRAGAQPVATRFPQPGDQHKKAENSPVSPKAFCKPPRTEAYRPTAYNLTMGQWDWKHRPPSSAPGQGPGGEQPQPYVAADLASAIRKNPHLKVFSANGYFDRATPFFNTEYDIAHLDLPADLRQNGQFGCSASGHMIYLNVDALHKLKDDLSSVISSATRQ